MTFKPLGPTKPRRTAVYLNFDKVLYRGSVEWGLGLRTAEQIVRRAQQTSTPPFHDFRLSRGVVWLAPTLQVELTYSEIMEGRLREPVYRGLVWLFARWVRCATDRLAVERHRAGRGNHRSGIIGPI